MSHEYPPVVLGGGAFGLALASVLARKNAAVKLYARDNAVSDYINQFHCHKTRLPNISLPHNITATSDISLALKDARLVVIALPMHALREVLNDIKHLIHQHAIVVCTTKGIDDNLSLPCDAIKSILPHSIAQRACYLSGPSFAFEVAQGLPTALVVAGHDKDAVSLCQKQMNTKHLRLYRSFDVIGVCISGAMKNVIAIASGASRDLGLGKNAQASLITRGLHEMTKLAVAMGAKAKTLSGLAGVGDLLLSCTDIMSRNYQLGTLLAQGLNLEAALSKIKGVVEGAKTAQAIPTLMKTYNIDMPISYAVHQVLYQGLKPHEAIDNLLARIADLES